MFDNLLELRSLPVERVFSILALPQPITDLFEEIQYELLYDKMSKSYRGFNEGLQFSSYCDEHQRSNDDAALARLSLDINIWARSVVAHLGVSWRGFYNWALVSVYESGSQEDWDVFSALFRIEKDRAIKRDYH